MDVEGVEMDAEGLRIPKIHCDTATILLGAFVRRQVVPMVYDIPKREEGFRGLTCPFPSLRLSWQ